MYDDDLVVSHVHSVRGTGRRIDFRKELSVGGQGTRFEITAEHLAFTETKSYHPL